MSPSRATGLDDPDGTRGPDGPGPPAPEVRLVTDAERLAACLEVRRVVFVEEQGVPVDLERDEHDVLADDVDHLVATAPDGRPLGTVRLVAEPGGVAHLGRLAVLPPARGTGLGSVLVRAVEQRARDRGLRTVVLGAQLPAIPFYERLGYAAVGEVFDDAGIDHRLMRRTVTR